MSIAGLQRQGRDAYQSKEYAKALEYFNRAAARSDPTPQVLDNLAATHDKLNDLPSALKAAKKTIQLGRDDPTGYLRAGLILKKMEKPSVALEIYAHGLKCVKHVGLGYEQLKRVHDALMQKLAPANSVDPFTILPRELGIAILEYLTFRQRIAISRVSKGWKGLIRSEPSLWSSLDLFGARTKVKSSFISRAINTAKSKLTSATLTNLYDFDKVLNALVRHCPLQQLILRETGMQGPSLPGILKKARDLTDLRIEAVTTILHESILREVVNALQSQLKVLHCDYVYTLDFRNNWELQLPKLRSLNLTTPHLAGLDHAIPVMSTSAPELRSLTIRHGYGGSHHPINQFLDLDLRNFSYLEEVNLQLEIRFATGLLLPPSIRILKFTQLIPGSLGRSRFFTQYIGDDGVDSLSLADMPHLEELELDIHELEFAQVVNQFSVAQEPEIQAPALTDLKSLTVRRAYFGEEFFEFYSRLKRLEKLSLLRGSGFTDEHAQIIAKELKNLKWLDLSFTDITGVGVKAIVMAGNVKHLIVNSCHRISRDAIDWGRSQGVKIEFKVFDEEHRGGKNVRYSH